MYIFVPIYRLMYTVYTETEAETVLPPWGPQPARTLIFSHVNIFHLVKWNNACALN